MFGDLSVLDTHVRLDIIHNLPSCFRKSITGGPVAGGIFFIEELISENSNEKSRALLQSISHMALTSSPSNIPNTASLKIGYFTVAIPHGPVIELLKGGVKTMDEFFVTVHNI